MEVAVYLRTSAPKTKSRPQRKRCDVRRVCEFEFLVCACFLTQSFCFAVTQKNFPPAACACALFLVMLNAVSLLYQTARRRTIMNALASTTMTTTTTMSGARERWKNSATLHRTTSFVFSNARRCERQNKKSQRHQSVARCFSSCGYSNDDEKDCTLALRRRRNDSFFSRPSTSASSNLRGRHSSFLTVRAKKQKSSTAGGGGNDATDEQQQKSSTSAEPKIGRSIIYENDGEIKVGVLEKRLGKSGWSILVANSSSASPTNSNISEKNIKFVMNKKRSLDDLQMIIERAKMIHNDGSLKLIWEICKEEEVEGNNKGATYSIEDLQEMLLPDIDDEEEAKTTLMLVLSESTNVFFKQQQQKSKKSSGNSVSDIVYTTRSEDDANALQKKLDAELLAKKMEDEFVSEIQNAMLEKDDIGAMTKKRKSLEVFNDNNGTRYQRLESLQAYASGDECYTSGQKASAEDLLAKLNFQKTSQKASELLVKLGIWREHEHLALRRNLIPVEFDDNLEQLAQTIQHEASDVDLDASSRVDLSRLTVYAVDDESTYEIDDGISIEKIEGEDEFYRIYIHVADPTRFITFDSPLDREARKRGTTLYLPMESIPMFPKALSGGKLSLRVANGERMPNEDNEGVALTVQVDVSRLNGSIKSYDIYPSSISGVTRMTYEDVDARLKEEGGKSDLHLLNECAIARYRKREDQGAINILLPELDVVVSNADARGGDARSEIFLRRRDNSASKILVSEMMILAGEIAGSFGVENSLALPFRGQGEPRLLDEETWDTIPDGVCAEMAMRSCMTASSQGITPRPHHSLGLSAYVQFTSPIRRYADLLAHYQIKSYLRSGKHSSEISNEKLELVLSEAGANASVGIKTQREISKYWVTEYFSRRLASSSNASTDNVYEATVVKSMRSEAFALALLEDTGFETPFKLLRENDFKLGEVVKIKVDSANPIEQQLFFSQIYESSEDHDDNDNNTNDNH